MQKSNQKWIFSNKLIPFFFNKKGNSNGVIEGIKYFECEKNYGLFCRPINIKRTKTRKKKKKVKKIKKSKSTIELEERDGELNLDEVATEEESTLEINHNNIQSKKEENNIDEEDKNLKLAIALSLTNNVKKNDKEDDDQQIYMQIYDDLFSKILIILQRDENKEEEKNNNLCAQKYLEIKEIILHDKITTNILKEKQNLNTKGSKNNLTNENSSTSQSKEEPDYPDGYILNITPLNPNQNTDKLKEAPDNLTEEQKQKMVKKRNFIIDEMIKTEEDYIHDLEIFEEIFIYGLEILIKNQSKNKELPKMKQVLQYSSTVKMLKPFSVHLLQQMKVIQKQPSDQQKIGSIFHKLGAYLKLYQQHCTYLAPIEILIGDLSEKDKEFRLYLEL